ncbi:kynureninase [Rhodobacterales bacterium 52_120_T64]|nr:kynureninase [Rhodobacterales bacterium 52_120_T64]
MTDFTKTKALFDIPAGVIYLDGNSLGPLPKDAPVRVASMMKNEWGQLLIGGWNKAGWIQQPTSVGDRIAKLIGAEENSVVMGDTLSIKVYQAVASALELNPDRKVILSDNGNFPTDLYMTDGLIRTLNDGHELRIVNSGDVEAAIDDTVAVLLLTEVDYRTGRKHDMKRLTEKAHAAGVLTVWDLAHSAGALPVDLSACDVDFAIGCTYKYLNGGPGAPAFIYVAPRHFEKVRPALSGWLGHETPFDFDIEYKAGSGIERMRIGTPPIIALAALESALDIWDMVNIEDVRAKSNELCDLFVKEVEARCPQLALDTPRNSEVRGSHVSFRFADGYAVMQALIARGVVGDFRAPDTMRFGFTPLYIDELDVLAAVDILEDIMTNALWNTEAFKTKLEVT